MTLHSTTNKAPHVGDGVTLTFPFNFRVDLATDMKVYLDTAEQASGWSIDPGDLGQDAGGDVVFAVAPGNGVNVTLVREVPLTQEVKYDANDPFPAKTQEQLSDKLTMITQQLLEGIGRAIQAPQGGDPGVSYELPAYAAGKGIMWDAVTKTLTVSDDDINGLLTACAAEVAAAGVQASIAGSHATDASQSESNALNSENSSAASAAAALASEQLADKWANEAEDVEVEPGKFSGVHWAAKALLNAQTADIKSDQVNVFTKMSHYDQSTDTTTGATYEWDIINDPQLVLSVEHNVSINIKSDAPAGAFGMIKLSQNTTGGYTVSFNDTPKTWHFHDEIVPFLAANQWSYVWLSVIVQGANLGAAVFMEREN